MIRACKYDGTRCVLIKQGSVVRLFGRSWNEYTNRYSEILEDAKKLKCTSCILDSELTFFKGNRDFFLTALAKSETKKGMVAKLMVFDVMEYDGYNVRDKILLERKQILDKILPDNLNHIEKAPFNMSGHRKFFEKIVSDPIQGEGIMLKRIDSTYQETRSKAWLKVKGWKSYDCVVLGLTEGTGIRKATFGAMILGRWDNSIKKFVFMGKTSGFSDSELIHLLNILKKIQTRDIDYHVPYNIQKMLKFWVKPEMVVEVKYQELTPDRMLRFPSFLRVRTDKRPHDAT